MSYSNYESHLFLQLIDDYEPALVLIIKYYIKTYTFHSNIDLKVLIKKFTVKQLENQYGYISYWDTSLITDMSCLFNYCYHFNYDISRWDVSKITNIQCVFHFTKKFNQPKTFKHFKLNKIVY